METVTETRKNEHKDIKKKKGKTFLETLRETRRNGNKDTNKKNKKCSCKY